MSEVKPFLKPMVTAFLEHVVLRSDMRVFEWGMGGSTTWLANRVRRVTSVEHDLEWYTQVPRQKNLDRILIPPGKGVFRAAPADPEAYFSSDEHWPRHNFKRYASAIDSFGLFDLIFVDGRARPSCLMHSYNKVRVGGFLMLDDAHRKYYLQNTTHFFDGWDKFTFFEDKVETTFWRKVR